MSFEKGKSVNRAVKIFLVSFSIFAAAFYGTVLAVKAQGGPQLIAANWPLCESSADKELCYKLGNVHFSKGATIAEKALGIPFFERACDLGHGGACAIAGKAIGLGKIWSYDRKNYVADLPRARTLFVKGCTLDSVEACTLLGRFQSRGIGGPVDRTGAMKSYDRGCVLTVEGRFVLAEACYQMGIAAAQAAGKSVKPNLALTYFDRGCSVFDASGDKFDGLSCLESGRAAELGRYGQPVNLQLAINRYKDACQKYSQFACAEQQRLMKGEGGIALAAANAASTAAYEANAKPACDAIGIKGQALVNAHTIEVNAIAAEADAILKQGDRTPDRAANVSATFEARFDRAYENFCHEILNLRDQANLVCVNRYRENMMSSLKTVAQKSTAGISGTGGNCRARLKY